MFNDRWDEGWETPGWGEMANGALLGAVVDGLDGLREYAAENPDEGDLTALLAEAERELEHVTPERCDEVLAALEVIHHQIALAAVPTLPTLATAA